MGKKRASAPKRLPEKLLEPSLWVLLQYARVANVAVEALIDKDLNLPEYLPANPKSEGIKKKTRSSPITRPPLSKKPK